VALIFTRHARDHMCRDGIAEAWVEAIIAQPEHSGFISQLLGKLKRFSQNHGVHIWIIAHPVRLPRENGKLPVPTLYDISGSAANKADVGSPCIAIARRPSWSGFTCTRCASNGSAKPSDGSPVRPGDRALFGAAAGGRGCSTWLS
jgi:hypothetical protein